MNPFLLRGPEFLLFYFVLCALVIAASILLRRAAESGDAPKVDLNDPYLIAYLRGGKDETLRVATLALIERKLLKATIQTIQKAENIEPEAVSHPLEQSLLKIFATPGNVTTMFQSPTLESATLPYAAQLEAAGLLPDEQMKAERRQRMWLALVIIVGTGLTKIFIALVNGRYNLGFLSAMMVVAALVVRAYASPRLTRKGEAFLEDLKTLYGHLQSTRLQPQYGIASTDTMMAAAIFGIGAMATYSYAATLFPRAYHNPSSSVSSCGSSCSSSGGSSCGGSSCGGGGCGGCSS